MEPKMLQNKPKTGGVKEEKLTQAEFEKREDVFGLTLQEQIALYKKMGIPDWAERLRENVDLIIELEGGEVFDRRAAASALFKDFELREIIESQVFLEETKQDNEEIVSQLRELAQLDEENSHSVQQLCVQANGIPQLCTVLEDQIHSLNNSPTEEGLRKADQVKKEIRLVLFELRTDIQSVKEQVLKEKYSLDFDEQLKIYDGVAHEDWADEIRASKDLIIKKILNNKESIEAKIEAGMRPILMPGRETQRKNWEQSLKDLKPYWREGGVVKEILDSYIWTDGYRDILSKPESWSDIPTEPYIVWTKPSQRVDPETTNQSVEDQKKLVVQKHKQHPNLYDQTDLHPLEYAALQVMHTYRLFQTKKSSEDILPLDYFNLDGKNSYIRFTACPLSTVGRVLGSGFFPAYQRLHFLYDAIENLDINSAGGFRFVSRT